MNDASSFPPEPLPTHAIGVEAIGVGKHFGSFHALSDVSLKVRPATVHGLLGETGAGKSTLVKCLLGYYRADEGSFLVDNHEVSIARPADADALGLGMVYQHFTLVPSMTVAENLVMSRANVPARKVATLARSSDIASVCTACQRLKESESCAARN